MMLIFPCRARSSVSAKDTHSTGVSRCGNSAASSSPMWRSLNGSCCGATTWSAEAPLTTLLTTTLPT
eukprot:6235561-Prorocentrum_lima.AAC.1